MTSKEEIRATLREIAMNNSLVGESVDLLVDQLTYALYHNQLEITNAVQESNLSTAKLMNSKIRSCMEAMYPVYRGRNPRVQLTFSSSVSIDRERLDLLYTSNTFKVYAEEKTTISPTGIGDEKTIRGILATEDLFDISVMVNQSNRFYIDLELDRQLLSDISEDIQVFIDGQEHPTTRNFFDHVNSEIPLRQWDAVKIGSEYRYLTEDLTWKTYSPTEPSIDPRIRLKKTFPVGTAWPIVTGRTDNPDSIFVLTIPDFGIRLYKRGYFRVNSVVRVRALKYCTEKDISADEFRKILLPGTELIDEKIGKNKLSKDNPSTAKNRLIVEVPRDDAESLLYNANLYTRVQSKVLSNSDINVLFTEQFRDYNVLSAGNYFENETKTVVVYYITRDAKEIPSARFKTFRERYGSYFVSNRIVAIPGELVRIKVDLDLFLSSSVDVKAKINRIFSSYENVLNSTSDTNRALINKSIILADISKIREVRYVSRFAITDAFIVNKNTSVPTKSGEEPVPPTFIERDSIGVQDPSSGNQITLPTLYVPTYYRFEVNLTTKMDYGNNS